MKLEQCHVVKFLHLEGLKLCEIAIKLSNMHGEDAYATAGIKYWLHELMLGRTDLQTQYICR